MRVDTRDRRSLVSIGRETPAALHGLPSTLTSPRLHAARVRAGVRPRRAPRRRGLPPRAAAAAGAVHPHSGDPAAARSPRSPVAAPDLGMRTGDRLHPAPLDVG